MIFIFNFMLAIYFLDCILKCSLENYKKILFQSNFAEKAQEDEAAS